MSGFHCCHLESLFSQSPAESGWRTVWTERILAKQRDRLISVRPPALCLKPMSWVERHVRGPPAPADFSVSLGYALTNLLRHSASFWRASGLCRTASTPAARALASSAALGSDQMPSHLLNPRQTRPSNFSPGGASSRAALSRFARSVCFFAFVSSMQRVLSLRSLRRTSSISPGVIAPAHSTRSMLKTTKSTSKSCSACGRRSS